MSHLLKFTWQASSCVHFRRIISQFLMTKIHLNPQMTSSHHQWLHSSVGYSIAAVSQGHGFKPRWSPEFFRLLYRMCGSRKYPYPPQGGSRKFQGVEGCERGKFPKGRGYIKSSYFSRGFEMRSNRTLTHFSN